MEGNQQQFSKEEQLIKSIQDSIIINRGVTSIAENMVRYYQQTTEKKVEEIIKDLITENLIARILLFEAKNEENLKKETRTALERCSFRPQPHNTEQSLIH